MQFKQNESVYTTDGQYAGHIDRVVIDLRTNGVTHVVVRAGVLLRQPVPGCGIRRGRPTLRVVRRMRGLAAAA